MKKPLKFAINFFIYIAIVAGTMFGLPKLLTFALDTPYPMAAITSGSMWPALSEGDLVIVQGVKKEELKNGDIIVFRNNAGQGFTIHRIVRINENTLITKGDANFTEDAEIKYGDVVGRAVVFWGKPARIPFLGAITMFASKNIKR